MPLPRIAAWRSALLMESVVMAGGWIFTLWLVSMSRQRAHGHAGPQAAPPFTAYLHC